ncbi:MAG: HisA/HisF-related TIM barrel protein [Bermanella sp.]
MDNKRIIGKILIDRNLAIQSKGFATYLPLGRPEILAEFLDRWQVDEILLMDRTASVRGEVIAAEIVSTVVEVCRTPLTVGGGITRVAQAELLVSKGADRIAINSAFHADANLVTQLSDMLGRQAVVVSLDFIMQGQQARVFDHKSKTSAAYSLVDACKLAEDKGAGELFIHSVDRDGRGNGYELDVYKKIVDSVAIPVIASGGYGRPSHVQDVMATGVSAMAIGNGLNYVEHSIALIKAYLNSSSIRNNDMGYRPQQVSAEGRLLKQQDDELDGLKFVKREGQWV